VRIGTFEDTNFLSLRIYQEQLIKSFKDCLPCSVKKFSCVHSESYTRGLGRQDASVGALFAERSVWHTHHGGVPSVSPQNVMRVELILACFKRGGMLHELTLLGRLSDCAGAVEASLRAALCLI